jgi:UvrD-like helicase C-terminal domain
VADALGLVAGTVPATPLKYSVSLAPGQYAQLDDVVVTQRELPGRGDIQIAGVVTNVEAMHEGARFASDVFLIKQGALPAEVCEVAEVTVTRVEPEMYVPPLPGAAVTRAVGAQRDSALYFDEMGSSKVPVGFARDGQPVYVNFEFSAAYRSARSGPVPRLIPCATLSEELDKAADLIRLWVAETDAPETIAVLVREQRQRDRLITGLAECGVTIRAVDREHIKPGQPVVMTMHRAKGTEFSKILLFGVDQGAIPRPLRDEQYAEDAWADALLRERSLLYVAATRARDELALSWSGDPSQLLPSVAEQHSS